MPNNTKKKRKATQFIPVYLKDYIDPELQIRCREYIGEDGEPRRLYGLTQEEREYEAVSKASDEAIKYALEYLNSPVSSPVQPHESSGEGQSTHEAILSLPKAPEPMLGDDLDFGEARARILDPESAHESAKKVNVSRRCKETLTTFIKIGGSGITEDATDYINHLHGRNEIPSNLTSRVSQLCKKGLLESRIDPKTGKAAKRVSRHSGVCTIWYVTAAGVEYARKIENEKQYV